MSANDGQSDAITLDVRDVSPRERHPLIFDSFASLRPGQSLRLVNDHDPKPLYYQFMAEHPGEVGWQYLEEGPDVWQVRIAKLAG
ncbi:MAG TPA: DUF2249 domain-containing protein [Thermomicrobiales bacterium]|nr:DUF2249 domain-containing protein [Thermomicrobiales bacterium]